MSHRVVEIRNEDVYFSKSESSGYRLHRGPPFENRERWGILSCDCSDKVGPVPRIAEECRKMRSFSARDDNLEGMRTSRVVEFPQAASLREFGF